MEITRLLACVILLTVCVIQYFFSILQQPITSLCNYNYKWEKAQGHGEVVRAISFTSSEQPLMILDKCLFVLN